MKIDVFQGVATLTTEVPVFVGTTGKGEPGATNFPVLGAPLKNFMFYPEKDDAGTLVFDCADEQERTPTSPTLLQFWWNGKKLVVHEGLHGVCFAYQFLQSRVWGLAYRPAEGVLYHHYPDKTGSGGRQVPILDLLRFLEEKISLEELDARVIK